MHLKIVRSLYQCWYQAQTLCSRPTIVHTKQNMCHVPRTDLFCFVFVFVSTLLWWGHCLFMGTLWSDRALASFPSSLTSFQKLVHIRLIRKVTLCFTLYRLFQCYLQSNEILLNLGMKCWNSAFNAQGSRVLIVVVQVGAVEIYVAAVLGRSGNRKHRWNSVYHQNWWKI